MDPEDLPLTCSFFHGELPPVEANMTPALARIRRFGINGPPLDARQWKHPWLFKG